MTTKIKLTEKNKLNIKTVGIIGALNEEINTIKAHLKNIKKESIAKYTFYDGYINTAHIIIVECGVGKVSATICAQIIIDVYKPDIIINTGCAGGINPDVKIGDTIIATELVEADLDIVREGCPIGYITSLKTAKMKTNIEDFPKLEKILNSMNISYKKGLITSQDQFIYTDEARNEITKHYPESLCTEMEGAAIAHVATQNNIPFLIIRSISDDEQSKSNNDDYLKNKDSAGQKSANIVLKFLDIINS